MNIISLLQNDHRNMETLVIGLQNIVERRARRQIFDELRVELEIHSQSEEDALYPRELLQRRIHSSLDDARLANHDILRLLNEMELSESDSDEWVRLARDPKKSGGDLVARGDDTLSRVLLSALTHEELERWGNDLVLAKHQLKAG